MALHRQTLLWLHPLTKDMVIGALLVTLIRRCRPSDRIPFTGYGRKDIWRASVSGLSQIGQRRIRLLSTKDRGWESHH